MQPLVDSDVLIYEVGFGSETYWKSLEKEGPPPFDIVAEMLDMRVANICAMVEATEPPVMYLTGKGNFRYDVAITQPYKERPSNKPFHYYNLKAYIKGKYEYVETVGMEADDAIAIAATQRPTTSIICTRDKDLRSVMGWHYGWELGNQPQVGPLFADEIGKLELSDKRNKLQGYGKLFFYGQLLNGDSVDSIPGLGGGCGPVKAFKILEGCTTLKEAFERCREAYRGLHGDVEGDRRMLEMGRLLHMTRYLDEWGNPIQWEFPY